MVDIYEKTYNTLNSIGYPVQEQGTFVEGTKLPETFITYQMISSVNKTHADNKPTSVTYIMQVTLYSRKPALKQSADQVIKEALIQEGYMRGSGRNLPYDASTGHYGFTCDYRFYDMED